MERRLAAVLELGSAAGAASRNNRETRVAASYERSRARSCNRVFTQGVEASGPHG